MLFTNSPHVKHYATYRDIYVNTVCNFIHECLMSTNSESLGLSENHGEEYNSRNDKSLPGLTKRVVMPREEIGMMY